MLKIHRLSINSKQNPIDPKERGTEWGALLGMVKQDMEKGISKDWGVFVGERYGYAIAEGTELEVMTMLQQYVPFVSFKVHPVATVSQAEEMIKGLTR